MRQRRRSPESRREGAKWKGFRWFFRVMRNNLFFPHYHCYLLSVWSVVSSVTVPTNKFLRTSVWHVGYFNPLLDDNNKLNGPLVVTKRRLGKIIKRLQKLTVRFLHVNEIWLLRSDEYTFIKEHYFCRISKERFSK